MTPRRRHPRARRDLDPRRATATPSAGQYENIGHRDRHGDARRRRCSDSDASHYFGEDARRSTSRSPRTARTPTPRRARRSPSATPVTGPTWSPTPATSRSHVAVTDDQTSAPSPARAWGSCCPGRRSRATRALADGGKRGPVREHRHRRPAPCPARDAGRHRRATRSALLRRRSARSTSRSRPTASTPTSRPGRSSRSAARSTWTYVVTNTGNGPLTRRRGRDDRGVAVTCPATALAVGESMTCTGAGTAAAASTTNLAHGHRRRPRRRRGHRRRPVALLRRRRRDPHREGTNGDDADDAPGAVHPGRRPGRLDLLGHEHRQLHADRRGRQRRPERAGRPARRRRSRRRRR